MLPKIAAVGVPDDQTGAIPEILHMRTVPQGKVMGELSGWIPPMKDELASFVSATRLRLSLGKRFGGWNNKGLWGGGSLASDDKGWRCRKKNRVVVCGNFLKRRKTKSSPTSSRGDQFHHIFLRSFSLAYSTLSAPTAKSKRYYMCFVTAQHYMSYDQICTLVHIETFTVHKRRHVRRCR